MVEVNLRDDGTGGAGDFSSPGGEKQSPKDIFNRKNAISEKSCHSHHAAPHRIHDQCISVA